MIAALFSSDGSCRIALYEPAVALTGSDTRQALVRSLRCMACGEHPALSLERCKCGHVAPDPDLEYMHASVFNDTSGFIGTYVCQSADWRDIGRLIEKDKAEMRTSRGYLKRLGRLDTVDEIQQWVNREYPGHKLVVEPISIPCASKETKPEYADLYKRCFRDNESETHGYLKWAAINWVTGNDLQQTQLPVTLIGADIEVTYVIPGNPVTKEWCAKGPRFIIPKGMNGRLPRGIHKIVDVYSARNGTFVECGETDALSLVAPIGCGLAKRVVWLPYLGLSKADSLASAPTRQLPAYSIRKAAAPDRTSRYDNRD